MPVYRCDWCGRFYSSPLPEGSACDNHIPEHNARLSASIARHNQRLNGLPVAPVVKQTPANVTLEHHEAPAFHSSRKASPCP
jgi:hypothetical protein